MATPRRNRVAAAVLFSLIMACLLGLGGFLGGSYLYGHFGPKANDADETDAYLCGLLHGGITAAGGGVAFLWKFWPRLMTKSPPASDKMGGA